MSNLQFKPKAVPRSTRRTTSSSNAGNDSSQSVSGDAMGPTPRDYAGQVGNSHDAGNLEGHHGKPLGELSSPMTGNDSNLDREMTGVLSHQQAAAPLGGHSRKRATVEGSDEEMMDGQRDAQSSESSNAFHLHAPVSHLGPSVSRGRTGNTAGSAPAPLVPVDFSLLQLSKVSQNFRQSVSSSGRAIKIGSNRSNGVTLYNLPQAPTWKESAVKFMQQMSLLHSFGLWDLLPPDAEWKTDNGERNDYCGVRFQSEDPTDAIVLMQLSVTNPDEHIRVEFLSGDGVNGNHFRRLGISTVGVVINEAFKRSFQEHLESKEIAIVGKPFVIRVAPGKIWVILRDGSRDSVSKILEMGSFRFGTPPKDFEIVPMRTEVPLHPFHCVMRNCRNLVDIDEVEGYAKNLLTTMGCPDEFVFSILSDGNDNWHFAVHTWGSTACLIKNWNYENSTISFDADSPVLLFDENMEYTERALARKRALRQRGRDVSGIGNQNILSFMESQRAAGDAVVKAMERNNARHFAGLEAVHDKIARLDQVWSDRNKLAEENLIFLILQLQSVFLRQRDHDLESHKCKMDLIQERSDLRSSVDSLKRGLFERKRATEVLLLDSTGDVSQQLTRRKIIESHEAENASDMREIAELEQLMREASSSIRSSDAPLVQTLSLESIGQLLSSRTVQEASTARISPAQADQTMTNVCKSSQPIVRQPPTLIGMSIRGGVMESMKIESASSPSVLCRFQVCLTIVLSSIVPLYVMFAKYISCLSSSSLAPVVGLSILLSTVGSVEASTLDRGVLEGETTDLYASLSLFTMFVINLSGTKSVPKMFAFADVVNRDRPPIVVMSETNLDVSTRRYGLSRYNLFFSPKNHGGVAIAVRQDVSVESRDNFIAHEHLSGRAQAVYVLLHTGAGIQKICVLGIYAPSVSIVYNPAAAEKIHGFWQGVIEFLSGLTCEWVLAGDFNTSVSDIELAAPISRVANREIARKLARSRFKELLMSLQATDLWSNDHDRNVEDDWTCRSYQGGGHMGSILDRVVVSKGIAPTKSEIFIHPKAFVPGTNHRMVVCRVLLSHYSGRYRSVPENVPTCPPQFRVSYPLSSRSDSAEKIVKFRDEVDSELDKAVDSGSSFEVTRESFDQVYDCFVRIVVSCAEKVFGRPRAKQCSFRGTSIELSQCLRDMKSLRRLRAAIREDRLADFLSDNRWAGHVLGAARADSPNSTAEEAVSIRYRTLNKDRFALQAQADGKLVSSREAQAESSMLRGQGSKAMRDSRTVIQPRMLHSTDGLNRLVSEPGEVKNEYVHYVSKVLYARTPSEGQKPWLTQPEVSRDFKSRTSERRMPWPLLYTSETWQAMLKTGNPKPSPGPDDLEKWYHRFLSKRANDISRSITNFVIQNNYWGNGKLKGVTMLALYKKGIYSSLANYRFLWLTNFHAAAATGQLARCLQTYVDEMSLLPPYQIATRPGVQTRDLTSFIDQLQCHVRRGEAETMYACQRDDMEGFDNQTPEAFEDAVEFFGLDRSILEFDRESNDAVSCRVRTAYGLTQSFELSGVNRQGGATSPIKFNLKAAMGYHWLAHHAAELDVPLIRPRVLHTGWSRSKQTCLSVLQLWAMDDSLLLFSSVSGLQKGVEIQELFNYAYGGKTNWLPGKSCAYSLHGNCDVSEIVFQSWDGPHCLSVFREVEFLKTVIGNQNVRTSSVECIITSMKIPRKQNGHRFTLALARSWIIGLTMPKIRAKLQLQPVSDRGAQLLDTTLISMIRQYMGWMYVPSRHMLFRAIKDGGFGFPSIQAVNRAILISSMYRDLNHSLEHFRTMAHITYNDLTCGFLNCANPFEYKSRWGDPNSVFPSSWKTCVSVIHKFAECDVVKRESIGGPGCSLSRCSIFCAHNLKKKLYVSLVDNRVSDIASGDVSILHMLRIAVARRPHGSDLRDVNSLLKFDKVDLLLSDVWSWHDGELRITAVALQRLAASTPEVRRRVQDFYGRSVNVIGSWSDAVNRNNTMHALNAKECEVRIETKVLKHLRDWIWDPTCVLDGRLVLATDGSKKDRSTTVTGAIVGCVNIGIKLRGARVQWAYHGELLAFMVALFVARHVHRKDHSVRFQFLTDYKLIVDRLETFTTQTPWYLYSRISDAPIYRLLVRMWAEISQYSILCHVKAHTGQTDIKSVWNDRADKLASRAFLLPDLVVDYPEIDTPAFTSSHGSSYSQVLKFCMVDAARDQNLRTESLATLEPVYGKQYFSKFRYQHALADWSVQIQALIRGRVLATAGRRYRDAENCIAPFCVCGFTAETEHHIFVECAIYEHCRADFEKSTEKHLKKFYKRLVSPREGESEATLTARLLQCTQMEIKLYEISKWLFRDQLPWPASETRFYEGIVPNFEVMFPQLPEYDVKKLKQEAHGWCIGLAGFIWGSRVRKFYSGEFNSIIDIEGNPLDEEYAAGG